MDELLKSMIRTTTPFIVSALLTWLAAIGISGEIDVNTITLIVQGLLFAAYYGIARVLEETGRPTIGGAMLLNKGAPNYNNSNPVTDTPSAGN